MKVLAAKLQGWEGICFSSQDFRVFFILCENIILFGETIISSPKPLGSQGELILYPWSGVRLSVVCRSSTIFKDLL